MQTGMNVFIFPGTNLAIAVNIFLSFIFIKIHGIYKPYLEDDEDFLGGMSHWMILGQLEMTIMLATEVISPNGAIGVMFFAISASLFVAVVAVVFKEMREHLPTLEKIKSIPGKFVDLLRRISKLRIPTRQSAPINPGDET
jgi:hypothetical protein